jgi:hypothetical protein
MAVIDLSSGEIFRVHMPESIANQYLGMTGCIPYGDGFICVLQGNGIATLNPEFLVTSIQVVDKVLDGHSVCVFEDSLLIACSGTNSVVRVWGDKSEVFWQGEHELERDTIHVNSVAVRQGEVYVTAFGKSTSDSWLQARSGWIKNTSTGEIICKDLFHPHSLTFVDDQWWVCESLGGRIVSNAGSLGVQTGYLRGLSFLRGTVVVASSRFRHYSRSTRQPVPLPNELPLGINTAGVSVFTQASPEHEFAPHTFIDLSAIADEIYDAVLLE